MMVWLFDVERLDVKDTAAIGEELRRRSLGIIRQEHKEDIIRGIRKTKTHKRPGGSPSRPPTIRHFTLPYKSLQF